MKKKTIANLIMVAIIVLVVGAGVLTVGFIQGWFDSADGTAVLRETTGVVRMERDGVSYAVEKDTVLRSGDKITAQKGATAVIAIGEDQITLGGGAELTVKDPDAENCELQITAGEVFVNTASSVKLTFELGEVTISDATAALSVRSGAQTVSVFRGTVENATAGNAIEYVGSEATVRPMVLSSLDDFLIGQIRTVGKTTTLCFTEADITKLETDRQQAMQDMISGQNRPEQHVHSYTVQIIAPGCVTDGYTEHTCQCGDIYRSEETAALGHDWSQWNTTLVPTSTSEGTQERTCLHCGETEQKTISKLTADHVHSYTEQIVNPTCTKDGYTLHTCVCGDSFTDETVKATGHHYEKTVIAPTCTVQGYTKHTCPCGDSFIDGATAAKGHSWTAWKTVQQPTASKEGLQERSCTVCSAKEQASIPVADPDVAGYVYIEIRCDTILNNMGDLTAGKEEFVPSDGVILPVVEVPFYEGETVFEVLKRVCEKTSIQLEYSWTPLYNSYYIEGINNLYEFDCGEQSGWMYKVNEWFPNYGCSSYYVDDGDVIVWCYTCVGLGADVGDDWMANE